MTRLASALRLEIVLQVRQRFVHAATFSGLIWLAVLLPMPRGLRPVVEPYILLGDTCIIGFFFIAGTVFFEKQQRTLGAVISNPLRFWEYLAAKLTCASRFALTRSARPPPSLRYPTPNAGWARPRWPRTTRSAPTPRQPRRVRVAGWCATALGSARRGWSLPPYRDPLLVMIAVAPIIWTTGVAVLTPRVTEL